MSRILPARKCRPGDASQRLGLRIDMCAAGERPWRAEAEGARWTIACFGLVQLIAGRGSCESAGSGQRPTEPGEVIVLLPGVWHSYGPCRGGRWDERCVFFSGPAAPGLAAALGWSAGRDLLRPRQPGAVQAILERIILAGHAGAHAALVPDLLLLLLELESALPAEPVDADGFQALLTALRGDPLHAWDFAAEARRLGISASTLRRRFVRELQVAPQRYLAEQRIRLAASRMLDGMPVAAAGRSVGFPDPAHFSRRFHAITGRSPRAFLAQAEL